MELHGIAVRCLVSFSYLLLITRLKGKHAVAQAAPFDFVLALILGDMIDDLLWSEVEVAKFMVATGVLVIADVFVTLLTYRSDRIFEWVMGIPRIVIADGRLKRQELRAEQMSDGDVEALLRMDGYVRDRYGEISKGVLEIDGQLSILPLSWAQELQKNAANDLRKALRE